MNQVPSLKPIVFWHMGYPRLALTGQHGTYFGKKTFDPWLLLNTVLTPVNDNNPLY